MHSLLLGATGDVLSTLGDNNHKQLTTFSPKQLPNQPSIMHFDLLETSIQKVSIESKNNNNKRDTTSPNVTIDDHLLQKSVEGGGAGNKRGSVEMHQVRIEGPKMVVGVEHSRKMRLQ